MSTTQSLYPKAKDCGCVKFVGGRKKRRTRRKYKKHHKKRKTHKRRRTRRHHKKRKTRRTRKGGDVQMLGGYKENLIIFGGGNRPILAVSDYPPGFSKFTKRDKRQWNKMKAQHKKKHRKK